MKIRLLTILLSSYPEVALAAGGFEIHQELVMLIFLLVVICSLLTILIFIVKLGKPSDKLRKACLANSTLLVFTYITLIYMGFYTDARYHSFVAVLLLSQLIIFSRSPKHENIDHLNK